MFSAGLVRIQLFVKRPALICCMVPDSAMRASGTFCHVFIVEEHSSFVVAPATSEVASATTSAPSSAASSSVVGVLKSGAEFVSHGCSCLRVWAGVPVVCRLSFRIPHFCFDWLSESRFWLKSFGTQG